MFWDNVAGVYDVFVNVINRKTHTRMCPNVDFCRANGYEDFLPAICAQDHKIASAMQGILIRTHTIARGDDYCDWWYFGDKQELPEEAKKRLKAQETDRIVSSIV